jgi:hypothetical protein
MVDDQETSRSPMEPKIHCVWIETGERVTLPSGKENFRRYMVTGRQETIAQKSRAASTSDVSCWP